MLSMSDDSRGLDAGTVRSVDLGEHLRCQCVGRRSVVSAWMECGARMHVRWRQLWTTIVPLGLGRGGLLVVWRVSRLYSAAGKAQKATEWSVLDTYGSCPD
jgi:hypothetical protein